MPTASATTGPTARNCEIRLALHSIYFPTAQPTPQKPEVGLASSQQTTLRPRLRYRRSQTAAPAMPDASGANQARRGFVPTTRPRARSIGRKVASSLAHRYSRDKVVSTRTQERLRPCRTNLRRSGWDRGCSGLAAMLSPGSAETAARTCGRILRLPDNRRVRRSRSSYHGQESVNMYPFNAADSTDLARSPIETGLPDRRQLQRNEEEAVVRALGWKPRPRRLPDICAFAVN